MEVLDVWQRVFPVYAWFCHGAVAAPAVRQGQDSAAYFPDGAMGAAQCYWLRGVEMDVQRGLRHHQLCPENHRRHQSEQDVAVLAGYCDAFCYRGQCLENVSICHAHD